MAYIIPLDLLKEDVDYQKGSVGIINGCFVLLTRDTSTLFLRKGFGEKRCDCISCDEDFPIENFVNFVNNKKQKGTWFAELGECYQENKQFYFYKDFNTCTKLCYKIKQTSNIENDERYTNLKNLVVSLEEYEPSNTAVFEFNNVTDLINMLTCFENNSVVHIINVKQNSIIFQDKTLFFKYNYAGPNIKPHSINTRIKINHLLQFLKYTEKISNKIFMWSLQENTPLFLKSTIKFNPQSPEYLIIAPYTDDQEINTADDDPDSQNLTVSSRPFLEERLESERVSFFSDRGATVTVSDSTVSFSGREEEEL